MPHAQRRLLCLSQHQAKPVGSPSHWPTRLLEQAGVAALSGTAFGEFGEGYLRFSVANSLENLQQALDRIDQWTNKNL